MYEYVYTQLFRTFVKAKESKQEVPNQVKRLIGRGDKGFCKDRESVPSAAACFTCIGRINQGGFYFITGKNMVMNIDRETVHSSHLIQSFSCLSINTSCSFIKFLYVITI